jgi:hypothetical protein
MISVLAVMAIMAAMVVVTALPAMAAPGNGAKHFSADFGDSSIKAVFTPSGVSNATSHFNPEGGNAGGTGGGGADVRDDGVFDIDAGEATFENTEAHIVTTPSGNINGQGHSKI